MVDLSKQSSKDRLTPRELEILRLVAEGLTNQEIGGRLFITLESVKWYLKQVYSKLQVSGRTQAVATAQASGLLDGTAVADRDSSRSRHNLPPQPTSFVGRASELAQIAEWLTDPKCRLLTVLGPGGIGKTRLALEAAAAQISRFRDGVYFTALAPLVDPQLMVIAIAEAVSFTFAPGQPLKNQLLNHLHDRQTLLVLDNIEHLLADVMLIPELLQAAPGLKIVITSRERLQLQSEVVFRLEGFSFSGWTTPEAAAGSSAVQLFLQSARRVNPSFELTAETMKALSSICRLVDGMPLGLLLAASWIDTLSVAEIAQEIEHSFEFLEGDWRDIPERQRSLRAVFEQSWRMLTESERAAMRCFSVFRGGFTREAAQQVAQVSVKTLTNLVNKSLLNRDPAGRFDIHELLRQYSAKALDQLPNEHQQVQTQFAHYYADFMDRQWLPLRSVSAKAAATEIEIEFDNVRAAWQMMIEQEQFAFIIMTGRSLWIFLNRRARFDEGIALFGHALDALHTDHNDQLRIMAVCELLVGLSNCYQFSASLRKAKSIAEQSLRLLNSHHAPELLVRAYIPLCLAENMLEEFQNMKLHAQQAIIAAQELPDPWYRATGLFYLGWALLGLGQYEDANRVCQEALGHFEKVGDLYYRGLSCVSVLGPTAFAMKHNDEAKQYYLTGITLLDDIGNVFEASIASSLLVHVLTELHEYEAAISTLRRGLVYLWKTGPVPWLLQSLFDGSKVFELHEKYAWSVMTLSLVVNHSQAFQSIVRIAQAELERLRVHLSPEDFSAAYNRGKTLDLNVVVAELLQDT